MNRFGRASFSTLFTRLLVASACLILTEALAIPITVTLNTSALSGTAAQLAFDLIDGDGAINSSVTISGFATDGSLGSTATTGGASGTLSPGPVTISDTDFFNEFLQGVTLGSSVSFTLDATSNFAGGLPDAFSFFILDSTATSSLVTTNLLGDALLIIDLDGSPTGTLSVASTTTPNIPISVTSQSVPIPASLLLLALGLPVLFWRGRVVVGSVEPDRRSE